MTQLEINYGRILFDLNLPVKIVEHTKKIFESSNELIEALENPSVKSVEKYAVIDKIFDKDIADYLKVLCDNKFIGNITQVFEAYDDAVLNSKNIIKATLSYVMKPSDEQIAGIKEMLCKEYNKAGVSLQLKEDPSLIGGFVLEAGGMEYDRSLKGRLLGLQKNLAWR